MKLLASVVSLFAVASLADKYPPGTNCHTNRECNNQCLDGTWTIMQVQGDYQLVCDPTAANPTQYYGAACVTDNRYDPEGGKRACDKTGGSFCDNKCYFSGKRTAQDDLSGSWIKACEAEASEYGFFETYVSASAAARFGYNCDVSKIFPNEKRDFAFQA